MLSFEDEVVVEPVKPQLAVVPAVEVKPVPVAANQPLIAGLGTEVQGMRSIAAPPAGGYDTARFAIDSDEERQRVERWAGCTLGCWIA